MIFRRNSGILSGIKKQSTITHLSVSAGSIQIGRSIGFIMFFEWLPHKNGPSMSYICFTQATMHWLDLNVAGWMHVNLCLISSRCILIEWSSLASWQRLFRSISRLHFDRRLSWWYEQRFAKRAFRCLKVDHLVTLCSLPLGSYCWTRCGTVIAFVCFAGSWRILMFGHFYATLLGNSPNRKEPQLLQNKSSKIDPKKFSRKLPGRQIFPQHRPSSSENHTTPLFLIAKVQCFAWNSTNRLNYFYYFLKAFYSIKRA